MSAVVRFLIYTGLSVVWSGFSLYLLSSGPVLALAFWLRETTGSDQFYLAMWLYFPFFLWDRRTPVLKYIEWWVVDVFQTLGPG